MHPQGRFRFGPFELNSKTRELRKRGFRIRLRGQPLEILELLLEKPGEVVTREEMRLRLWPANTFVEFEHSLNTAIKKLRRALGESADHPRYVETLPRAGYRFIAAVERMESVEAQPGRSGSAPAVGGPEAGVLPETHTETQTLPAVGPPAPNAKQTLTRKTLAIAGGAAVALVVALGAYVQWLRVHAQPKPGRARVALAVLPFENLTGDIGQDYFSDGLTEEMIAQLGRLDAEHLSVVARTSVMHYQHTRAPLDQIGRELGVQYVLEGSVRRDVDDIRISAQLIQLKDQAHLWSRQYDRQPSGLLSLQTEIAQEVSDEIGLVLGDAKRNTLKRRPAPTAKSYESYDLYLRGRYYWNKRTPQGFRQAADCFEQAIGKDPAYARAYAGLADTYALMSIWGQVPQNAYMAKARAAALKALQIDEGLAEAHASLALIAEQYDYDWQTAEKEFRTAIQLDPSYATARQWYAECLSFQGRFAEALAESESARQLDPLSLIIGADHGAILYLSRQYNRAIEQFRAELEMEPSSPRAHMIVMAYVAAGRFAEALADVEQTHPAEYADSYTWSMKVFIYGKWGRKSEAQSALKRLERALQAEAPESTLPLLIAYAGLDHREELIVLLQKAIGEHSNAVMTLKVDPIYDSLRSDTRFQELLSRMGL